MPDFAYEILAGTDANGDEVGTEKSQRLSFEVAAVSGSQFFEPLTVAAVSGSQFFFEPVTMYSNGTAVFHMIANRFGVVILRVSLHDDGGREHGGKDSFSQTVMIDILRPSVMTKVGEESETIDVYETPYTTRKNVLPRWKSVLSPASIFLQMNFNVTIPAVSAAYFVKDPEVLKDGTLTFQLQPGAFGVAQVHVDISTKDLTTGLTQHSLEHINISIHPVNSVTHIHTYTNTYIHTLICIHTGAEGVQV